MLQQGDHPEMAHLRSWEGRTEQAGCMRPIVHQRPLASAERGVTDMQANLDAQRASGGEVEVFEQSVVVAREALVQFRTHRDLIVTTISDIRAGRIPSS
jgi:hypothetical protein